jgi:hypothetical protein
MTESVLYLITTPAMLTIYSSAIDAALGIAEPVRGTVVGGPDCLPLEYEGIGTPGYTDAVYRGAWVSADRTEACVEVRPEMTTFAGMPFEWAGQAYVFPTLDEGVTEVPDRFLPENGGLWWNGAPLTEQSEEQIP